MKLQIRQMEKAGIAVGGKLWHVSLIALVRLEKLWAIKG